MVNSDRTWASQTPPGHISPGPPLRPPARGEGRRLEGDGEGDEKMVIWPLEMVSQWVLTCFNQQILGFSWILHDWFVDFNEKNIF